MQLARRINVLQMKIPCGPQGFVRQASSSSSKEQYLSTGVHHARYPQQEMLEIHRRHAKIEDAKLERRRRIGLVKIAIAAGGMVMGGISVILFFYFLVVFPYWQI
jgi:hypothetical protein